MSQYYNVNGYSMEDQLVIDNTNVQKWHYQKYIEMIIID